MQLARNIGARVFAMGAAVSGASVTMIVPFPAGGATVTQARFRERQHAVGQTIVIAKVGEAVGSLGGASAMSRVRTN